MECNYKLVSFGIPEELLLSDHEGNLKQEYVDFWIQRQKDFEQKLVLQKQTQQDQLCHQLKQDLAVKRSSTRNNPSAANNVNGNGKGGINEIIPTEASGPEHNDGE